MIEVTFACTPPICAAMSPQKFSAATTCTTPFETPAVVPLQAQSPTDAALFDRDLAEARLFAGDLPGAAAAARSGLAELAQRPTSAQLQLADRSLFERDLSAIQAAANLDSDELTQIAQFGSDPPDADPWYLLGWFYERAGDTVQARTAYQAYLELAPAWSFLRRAAQMQHHAKDFVS